MSSLKINLLLEMLDRVSGPARRMGQNMSSQLEQVSRRARETGQRISDLGKSVSLMVSAPTLAFGTLAVREAANIERITVQFESLLGSAEAAQEMVKDMTDFAARSPFEMPGVAKAAVSLVSARVAATDMNSEMEMLGDLAALAGSDISDLARIYSRVKMGTFAQTMEIEMMSDRGIPIWQALVDVTSKSIPQIRKDLASGKVSFEIFQKALRSMTAEGGLAFRQMDKQSATFWGLWSGLIDNINLSLGKVGAGIMQELDMKARMDRLTDTIARLGEAFKTLPQPVQRVIVFTGVFGAALGPVLIAVGQLTIGIAGLLLVMSKLGIVLSTGGLVAWFTTFGSKLMFVAKTAIPLVVTALRVMTLAVVSNPITAFLVLLGALAIALVSQWEVFRVAWKKTWEDMKSTVAAAWEFIRPIIDAISNAASVYAEIGQTIGGFAGGVIRYATTGEIGRRDAPQPNIIQPQLLAPAAGQQRVDTGGRLEVAISDERVRVKEARTNDPRQNMTVETGLLMGGL